MFIYKNNNNYHQLDWEIFKNNNTFNFVKNNNTLKILIFKKVILNNLIKNLSDFYLILSPLLKKKNKNLLSGINLYKIFNYKIFNSAIIRYTFDQFNDNKPYYNLNSNNLIFFKNEKMQKILNYLKNFNISYFKNFNEFYVNYYFTIKKNKKEYSFYQYNFYLNYPIVFLYWFLLIPYFFYAYILSRYHIGFLPVKRRKLYTLFKALICDNLKIFIYFNKYFNRKFIRKFFRSKRPRMHDLAYFTRKRLKRSYIPKRHLWYRYLYVRLSGLGDYYFWFARINFFKYKISYKNFFFNSIMNSIYYNLFYKLNI